LVVSSWEKLGVLPNVKIVAGLGAQTDAGRSCTAKAIIPQVEAN